MYCHLKSYSCTSSGTRILPESRNLWHYPSTTASTGRLFKWQYIAFFRAYLDTILKALLQTIEKLVAYRYLTYLEVLLQAASLLYFLSDWKLVGSLGICLKESPFHLGSFSQVCALTNLSDVFTNLFHDFFPIFFSQFEQLKKEKRKNSYWSKTKDVFKTCMSR